MHLQGLLNLTVPHWSSWRVIALNELSTASPLGSLAIRTAGSRSSASSAPSDA